MFWPTRPSLAATLIIQSQFFRTGSSSSFHSLLFHILHLCHGHQGWLILQLSFSLAIITLVLPWLINCWQAVSVCPDLRHGKISEMFIPTIYLSPTCPFMTSELLASVCQSGKSSLANASLLASRFGKNRHCWKKCFSPLLCLSQVQSGQSISCDWAVTLFFSNTFSMPLYQLLVLVFCKQFCARSREMDIWKHKTVLQTRNSVKQFKEAFCTSNTCSGSIRGSDRYSEVKLSIAILCKLIG